MSDDADQHMRGRAAPRPGGAHAQANPDDLTLAHPDITMADAYAVQNSWRALKIERGERIVGHKIGLTSKAMQAAVGINEPDSGFLTERMLFGEGPRSLTERFIGLRIEAELAFVMKRPLSGRAPDNRGCDRGDGLCIAGARDSRTRASSASIPRRANTQGVRHHLR